MGVAVVLPGPIVEILTDGFVGGQFFQPLIIFVKTYRKNTLYTIQFYLELDIWIIYNAIMLFDIGKTIREARKNCKMTQEELAEKLGMSRTTIGQIENGTVQDVGVRKLIRLLDLLGLELKVRSKGRPPTLEELRNEEIG